MFMYKQNMEKYSKPNLPNPRCVFEDLSSPNIQVNETLKFITGEEMVRDAYHCYINFEQLQKDISEQQDLNSTLEELNKELMDNIENMRKQQNGNE